jgi:hypothetical protein
MTPIEVCEAVKTKYGLSVTRHTLLRYQKAALVTEPKRGCGGQGFGRYADYPPEAVEQLAIGYNLVHRVLAQKMNISQLCTGGSDITEKLLHVGTIVDISDAGKICKDMHHLIETGAVDEIFYVIRLASGNSIVRWAGDILSLLPKQRRRSPA